MAACHTLPPLCACVGAEPMVWRYDIKGISEAEQPQQSSTFKFKCKARSQVRERSTLPARLHYVGHR
eukprot:scaffold215343_cov17-Tisochrysis_lutea.AAC.1